MGDRLNHVITIAHETFGMGYDVIVRPAPFNGSLDREFRAVADAQEYARELHVDHGWIIRNLIGEGAQ